MDETGHFERADSFEVESALGELGDEKKGERSQGVEEDGDA